MPTTYSPLRYPGGKSSTRSMVETIINHNGLLGCHYIEPFAGGCGLALALLFKEAVTHIYLNDIDRSVWSFWHAALNQTERLINTIETTEITMDEWYKQRIVQDEKENADPFDLAFSTLFLNRTNRSGIIKAGVIGGKFQTGKYKLDCRFSKAVLVKKLRKIGEYRDKIHLFNSDAEAFIPTIEKNLATKKRLFLIDPPYYNKGAMLYTNFYNDKDHRSLADTISKLDSPWIVTYDNEPKIETVYKEKKSNIYHFTINYSAAMKRKGIELLITNRQVKIPNISPLFNITENHVF